MFVPTLVAALTAFVARIDRPEAIPRPTTPPAQTQARQARRTPAALAAFAPPVVFAPFALASWLECAAVAGLVAALLDAGDDDEGQ
jgi:hypothetical protein